ncbi:hypothetical protein D7241_10170 [Stutzerimonas sp. VN223-3]|uniref:hypothetical protein n=1 Tax=Stutzerimonas sp. VN223-3 TaxID=3384601 RepID=UPI0038B52C5A
MKSKGWWLCWVAKAYMVFTLAALIAFLTADFLVWLLKGQKDIDFYERFLLAVSNSWRLGGDPDSRGDSLISDKCSERKKGKEIAAPIIINGKRGQTYFSG